MAEENINRKYRLKKVDEIRNYLIEEINRNKLMRIENKKVCRVSNYIEHSLIVISIITGCVSISTFGLLVGISIGTTSSAVGLKFWVITAGIKRSTCINKKRKISVIKQYC